MDAINMMPEEQMIQILSDVFDKFDSDGSGTMELPQFKVAWRKELNLGGNDAEIAKSFKQIDADNSGVIEKPEFIKAIRSERLAELNMKVIASNMEGAIDSLGAYMADFQHRYETALAKAKRRRQNRKKFLERLMQRSNELLAKLEAANSDGVAVGDEEGAKFYKQLNDTYDAFDKDGSGELGYPEYNAAWRFLGQRGTDRDIKNAFDTVDVDRSGLVDRDEFILSIMGPEAEKYGPIADLEKLDAMMDGLLQLIDRHSGELNSLSKTQSERDDENRRLTARMKNQRNELTSGMNNIMKAMMTLTGTDMDQFLQSQEVDKYLVEAFNKYDKNGNGTLSYNEFKETWEYMGLGGDEYEIRDAFSNVDTDRSGVVEFNEFSSAIKDSRLSELGIKAILGSLGVELDVVMEKFAANKGSFDSMQSTMRRRAQKANDMMATITGLLSKLMEKIIDKTDGNSILKRDTSKQQLYNDLNDTFKAFDRDGNATLQFPEYQEAWRFLNLPGDASKCKEAFDSVDIDRSGTVDLPEFLYSIMGQEAENYGYLADMEILQALLEKLLKTESKEAMEALNIAQKTARGKDLEIERLQAELKRIRDAEGGRDFNELIQRMMFKCGVTRIGPLTQDELTNEIDSAFASSTGGNSMDRSTFREVVNSKKLMELRLRKLIAEIQADYWLEAVTLWNRRGRSKRQRPCFTTHSRRSSSLTNILTYFCTCHPILQTNPS